MMLQRVDLKDQCFVKIVSIIRGATGNRNQTFRMQI